VKVKKLGKPCPFCGAKVRKDTENKHYLICKHKDGCWFREYFKAFNLGDVFDTIPVSMIETWNKRTIKSKRKNKCQVQ